MPVTLSGSWDADSRGFWSTQSGFSSNLSVYTIEFRGTSLTHEEYKDSMQKFKAKLQALGNTGKSKDTAWNTLAFAAFDVLDPVRNI